MPMLIDLSHSIEVGMPVYPGTLAPQINETCSIDTDGFKETCIKFLTHTGTHIDVPAHLVSGGKPIDSFECNKFYGPAKVIYCKHLSRIDENLITKVYNHVEKPEFLLFFTGWSDYWGDTRYFVDFPLLTPEAVRLICQLPLKGIGIDAISFDATGNDDLPNHKMLLEKEIILIENLCNLNLLIEKNFFLSCLPLKIKGVDGSPVRACAIIPDR
jgi:kynurenine formamidase